MHNAGPTGVGATTIKHHNRHFGPNIAIINIHNHYHRLILLLVPHYRQHFSSASSALIDFNGIPGKQHEIKLSLMRSCLAAPDLFDDVGHEDGWIFSMTHFANALSRIPVGDIYTCLSPPLSSSMNRQSINSNSSCDSTNTPQMCGGYGVNRSPLHLRGKSKSAHKCQDCETGDKMRSIMPSIQDSLFIAPSFCTSLYSTCSIHDNILTSYHCRIRSVVGKPEAPVEIRSLRQVALSL